jgi:hypothetical protein
MKADIWNLVDILMNHDPRQGQLIPEEMMPFNLAGETLPPPPQEIKILCDENHCFCDTLDEYGDSVCKHEATQTTAADQ